MKGTVKKEGNRDILIELLRVIGCLIVVATHVSLDPVPGGNPDLDGLFLSGMVSNGVNIFWVILGCFLLTDKSPYLQRVKKSLIRVVLPVFLFSAFTFYFSDMIYNGQSLVESVSHSAAEYKFIFVEGLLKWKDAAPYGGHLWFMYVYFAVILFSPAVIGMGKVILKDNKSRLIGLAGIYLLLLANDVSQNGLLQLSYFSTGAVVGATFFVLLGGVLYQYKDKITGSIRWGMAGVLLFFGGNLVRAIVMYYGCRMWNLSKDLLLWYSSFAVIAVVGMFLMVFGFGGYIQWKAPIRNVILHMGKLSTYIYFIHALVVFYFIKINFTVRLAEKLATSWYGSVLYLIVAAASVFAVTFIISELIYWLWKALRKTAATFIKKTKQTE